MAESVDWEDVLTAAAHLQSILPEAVLVGGTASAVHVGHRVSTDADHVVADLRERFDEILAKLESVAGWNTARVKRPVLILGNLDGIDTGIRQLIRKAPLETESVQLKDGSWVTIPTLAEILRIKGALILSRNAFRDYVDFAALADSLGRKGVVEAMRGFDELYPQANGESALMQLQIQLAKPMPYDLQEDAIREYKHMHKKWQSWNNICDACVEASFAVADALAGGSA